jgi:hypothetical protein
LELAGLYEVTFLYEEKKHCIPSLLKLNKILEREGIHMNTWIKTHKIGICRKGP